MGRSVETVRDSYKIYFDAWEFDEDGYDWSDLIDNVRYDLTKKYKSLHQPDGIRRWLPYPFRETAVILENDHIRITISGYCGVGVFCIFTDDESEYPELAEHWLEQNIKNIEEIISQYCTPLRRLGTFSNGEAVFERK